MYTPASAGSTEHKGCSQVDVKVYLLQLILDYASKALKTVDSIFGLLYNFLAVGRDCVDK